MLDIQFSKTTYHQKHRVHLRVKYFSFEIEVRIIIRNQVASRYRVSIAKDDVISHCNCIALQPIGKFKKILSTSPKCPAVADSRRGAVFNLENSIDDYMGNPFAVNGWIFIARWSSQVCCIDHA